MEDDTYLPMDYTSIVLSMVKEFHDSGIYGDIEIKIGDKLFNCQRSILAANSMYFHSMFKGSDPNETEDKAITLPTRKLLSKRAVKSKYMDEALRSRRNSDEESDATGREPVTTSVTLNDIDAEAFERILHFMYTGVLETKASDDLLKLLVLSDTLRLRTDHFRERMFKLVKISSKKSKPMECAFDLLSYACDKEENELVDIMSAHICRHLYHFSQLQQLLKLSLKQLSALLERSNDYILPLRGSANVLVKILYDWINFNREIRSKHRVELMRKVNFVYVSSELIILLINRLENVVDEFLNLPTAVGPSESEAVSALIVEDLLPTKFQVSISLNVRHISEQPKGAEIFSEYYMISHLSWKISFERCSSDSVDFYLWCYGTPLTSKWNIHANAHFIIKSHKEGGEDFGLHLGLMLFSYSGGALPLCWGPRSSLSWSELVDPDKGYVAEDDSVTLIAHVETDVPFLNYDSE